MHYVLPVGYSVRPDEIDEVEGEGENLSIESRLRSLGILSPTDGLPSDSIADSTLKGIGFRANLPQKKVCLLAENTLILSRYAKLYSTCLFL